MHRIDLFAATPGSVLAAVAAEAEEVTLDAGAVLIEAGAVEDCFYAILTGRVQVLVNGRVLVEAGPGSTVGELAVLGARTAIGDRDDDRAERVPSGAQGDDRRPHRRSAGLRLQHHRCARRQAQGDVGAPGVDVTIDRARATVLLLAAQAVGFGVAAALLVIPANGIFLAAYGAEWLPLTYVGIALLGTTVVGRHRSLAAPLDPADGRRRRARSDRRDAAGHLVDHGRHRLALAVGRAS